MIRICVHNIVFTRVNVRTILLLLVYDSEDIYNQVLYMYILAWITCLCPGFLKNLIKV